MIFQALQSRAKQTLKEQAASPRYAWVVGGLAFAAALSVLVPFGGILAGSVLLSAKRWRSIALCASTGSALGALILFVVFKYLGWGTLLEAYPELHQSHTWTDARIWLSRYGVASLMLTTALPIPLTPALVFAALSDLPVVQVLAALWLGRWIKFSLYAWTTSKFPDWWKKRVLT